MSPGSTPPDSAHTSGVTADEPVPTRRITPSAAVAFTAVGLFALAFLTLAAVLILDLFGVVDWWSPS